MYVSTPEAVALFAEGNLVLAEMSRRGMRIDHGYLMKATEDAEEKIREYENEIRGLPAYRDWKRRFGDRTNIASYSQIEQVIFTDLGYKPRPRRPDEEHKSRNSASEAALEHVDHPLKHSFIRSQKFRRLRGTYLEGIRREMVEVGNTGIWVVHPNFNLFTVATFRSSADAPNIQNAYVRDPEFKELFRRTFIPRRGKQFSELDLSSAEVKVAADYHLDPVALAECNDPNADPHRDAACKLFFLKPHEVAKFVRSIAKPKFVFAQFYGDYYVSCAKNIWHELLDTKNAVVKDSKETILERLAKNGITKRGACLANEQPESGTFEAHVKEVENWYWNIKYKVYTQWKKDWWEKYQNTGGFITKTGFATNGVYDRKKVINYVIQGSAFHILLWSLIRQSRGIRRYKMDVGLLAETHDSSLAETSPRERDAYIDMSVEIMTKSVVKAWPWLEPAPPGVEVEGCPIEGSWVDKMQLRQSNDTWVPGDERAWIENFGLWV